MKRSSSGLQDVQAKMKKDNLKLVAIIGGLQHENTKFKTLSVANENLAKKYQKQAKEY